MLTINTNLSSLIAQQSLKQSTNKLNTAIERMTTGFKINSAKDNAANYSISTNMTTKIGAYQVAEDNAAMGLDLIGTAEGTLSQIQDKLARLRALAEQAANGTYGEQSLNAINTEVNAIVDEIERIYANSEYNGIAVGDSTKGAGCDMESLPTVGASGFITEVQQRDTSRMTKFEDVAVDQALTSGTYSISTPEELVKLSLMTNNKLIGKDTEFVLANDIDLSGIANWEPIGGYNSTFTTTTAFKGTFDGNGYVIKNLKYDTPISGYTCVGLFGAIKYATIKNLGIENANMNMSYGYHGGVLYDWDHGFCQIENCYTNGVLTIVNGGGGLGLLVAESSVVKDSYSDVDIVYQVASGYLANYGGLVSSNHGKIINCFATGDITGNGEAFNIGGLAGCSSGLISNCYATGNVAGVACIGGLVGWLPGDELTQIGLVENCYSSGEVTLTGLYGTTTLARAGGLFGSAKQSTIRNCSTTSKVTTTMSDSYLLSNLGTSYTSMSNLYTDVKVENCTYDSSVNPTLKATEGTIVASNIFNIAQVKDSSEISLQVGINGDKNSQISLDSSFKISGLFRLKNLGLDDYDYLTQIDKMITSLNKKSTEFGAVSNRLESVLDEIQIQHDNLVSSRSTLRDADIAEVSAEYIQQQILQQASATLLATANQSPSIALQLI